MDLMITGRTALVTGASSGIGRGIAVALAREGVAVAIAGRDQAALTTTAAEAASVSPGATPAPRIVAGDLSTAEGARAIAAQALQMLGGRIDILVNNAGASRPAPADADDAFWAEAFALNFDSARRVTEAIAPTMRASGWGRIINLSGALTAKAMNASAPAKSALVSWSRTMAIELAPFGITVNTIAPGRINSEQIRKRLHPTDASRDEFIRQNIPAGYFGEPEDIAHLVAFLSSPLARYISGAAIPVDGAMIRIV